MNWIDPEAATLQQLFARHSPLAEDFADFSSALWRNPWLPPSTLELCRLRLARLLDCSPDLIERPADVPVPAQQKVALLSRYADADEFTAAERACLAFTEVYCQDPKAISDELAAAVTDHHGDPGLVLLVQALGLFNGVARMSMLLELDGGR